MKLEFKFSMYWVYAITFFSLNIVLIIFNIFGKHALDLYPVFAMLWALFNVVIVKYATSVTRYALIIVGMTVFDGFVDGFAHHNIAVCGDIKWLHPPFAVPWDFTTFPYSHPLTIAYLIVLWAFLVPMQFLALTYYFTDYYTKTRKNPKLFKQSNVLQNNLILLIALLFIESFGTSDHFNIS